MRLPNTLSSYLRDIRQFAQYLSMTEAGDLSPGSAGTDPGLCQLDDGARKIGLHRNPFTGRAEVLYHYLTEKGVVAKKTPVQNVSAAKAERHLPQILTSQEVELFLEQPQCTDMKGYRDHAMLELLYATGIRVSELIALNSSDLNLSAGFIRCAGKKKERMIPLYPAAVNALREYVEAIRPNMIASPEEEALFVNMNGERMSRQGFWKIIKFYQEKAHIEKILRRIHYGTPLQPICSRTEQICGRFRKCWGTQIFHLHRFIPI